MTYRYLVNVAVFGFYNCVCFYIFLGYFAQIDGTVQIQMYIYAAEFVLYTNAHFRRQIVMFMLRYKKYFYSLLKQSIMVIYGNERFTEDQLETLESEN